VRLYRGVSELEAQIEASRDAIINIPKLQHTIELLQRQLKDPDFAVKRDFMESMGITVWLDGEEVEVKGTIDPNIGCMCTRFLEGCALYSNPVIVNHVSVYFVNSLPV